MGCGAASGRSNRAVVVAAVFAVMAAMGVGAGVAGSAFRKPPTPIIATVNLENVFNGLAKRAVKEQEFEAQKQELRAKLEALQTKITEDEKRYQITPDGPAKKQMRDQLVRDRWQLENDLQFAEKFLDQIYGEMLREMYEEIAAATKELAVKSGYTMVMADDSEVRVRGSGRTDVNRVISLKRLVYVDPAHDVTKELTDMMNNQFAASGGK